MSPIESLSLDPQAVSALGWTLIHFVWQGLAIAILLRLVLPVLRGPVARYNASATAMALMAIAPVVTFWRLYAVAPQPEATVSGLERAGAVALEAVSLVTAARGSGANVIPGLLPQAGFQWSFADAAPLCVAIWLAGVALLSLRSLGGWLILRRIRRQCSLLPDEIIHLCHELGRRLDMRRPIGFFEARGVHAPAVIGWFKPIVLLPVSALTGLDPVQLEAVIAHELAHIKRHDAFVNLFQIAMETVFFYHPAVWCTSRLIRQERELCCDDVAVALSGEALPYAKALALMEEWRQMPQFALAVNSQPLKSRIARLLGSTSQNTMRFPAPTMLLMLLLASASAAVLARPLLSKTVNVIENHILDGDVTERQSASMATSESTAAQTPPSQKPLPEVPATPTAAAAPAVTTISDGVPAPTTAPHPTPAPAPTPAAESGFTQDDQPASANGGKTSYIAEMAKAGYTDLTVDELVSLKIQGITPEYVEQVRKAGLSPTVHELIGMKVQGVSPQYIQEVRSAGWPSATVNDIIGMKVQGVNPADAAEYRKLGFESIKLHDLVGLKIQGVTPAYIEAMRAAGAKDASVHEYMGAKIQGVTPEYFQEVRNAGFPNASLRDVVGMKIQGVNPSDAAAYTKLGFQNIGLKDLIGMKIQGVTPEYIAAMRAAGVKSDSVHDYVGAKIQGVTPEFVEKARQHGFKDLDLHKLIALKMADVL